MMKAVSVNCGLFVLAILICGCFTSFAQTKTCNLQIRVYEFKENDDAEKFPVKDAVIKLVNTKTKKTLKIKEQNGTPTLFDGLAGTEYEITISKNGFQKTQENRMLDCESADAENKVSAIFFLWEGDSNKFFQFPKSFSDSNMRAVESDAGGNSSGVKSENKSSASLVQPKYPSAARAVKASGSVEVQVTINELGYVISAKAVSGHPLLYAAAVEVAQKSRFSQTRLSGIPVKVTGIIVYNFVP